MCANRKKNNDEILLFLCKSCNIYITLTHTHTHTRSVYTLMCGMCGYRKKAGVKLSGYKPPRKKDFLSTYMYTLYTFFIPGLLHAVYGGKSIYFFFLPHCVRIYICIRVRRTSVCAISFFNLSFTGNWIGFCVCMRDHSGPIKRNTIFST